MSAEMHNGKTVFKDSVLSFQKRQKELTSLDRKRFLVYQAKLDELVPSSTSYLEGAHIVKLPVIIHSLAILHALTKNSDQLIDFLGS